MKKNFCNLPETITRESRWVLFFHRKKLSYNQNLRGYIPNLEDYIFKVRVNDVRKFNRKIDHKEKDFNPYINIGIDLRFFPINSEDIKLLQGFERRNHYVVILLSNDDLQCYGNDREPMSFRIEDKIVDNASGADAYRLIIEGATTIKTKRLILPEKAKNQLFKVLLYLPPQG